MIYVVGTSLLHRLHPLTKIVLAVLLILLVNLFAWQLLPSLVFGIVLVMALLGGVARPLLSITLRVLLPVFLSLLLIQGILFPPANATTITALGPVRITVEGLEFAFVTATRLLAISTALLLVLLTTHPADLVAGLSQLGLPRSIGYVLIVTLQIAPDISKRAGAILEAQQSRGLETGRGIKRLQALPSLIGPLIVGALADVEERAMAIESRAFLASGPKTSLRLQTDSSPQRVMRWAILVLCVALIVARFTVLRVIA